MQQPGMAIPCTVARAACVAPPGAYQYRMFTIEHEFDCTVVTLVDDDGAPLQEDVIINAFAECITVEQYDPRRDDMNRVTLSMAQLRDLAAALNLPEGSYVFPPKSGKGPTRTG